MPLHRQRAADRTSRADLLRGAGVALAGVTALGVARFARAADRDEEALNLLLKVEYAEVGLYSAALESNRLTGELRAYARTVLGHERDHLAALRQALGAAAEPEPKQDFARAIRSPEAFADAAGRLEDLAVSAYNGQATGVSKPAFVAAATIVSVEARHAAWIRSIVGRRPAPDATDTPLQRDEVLDGLRDLGVQL
jgi:hypothetical protein